jgi:two-component system, chemotaxis family, protein-glutamate methylesterase/glutaminase
VPPPRPPRRPPRAARAFDAVVLGGSAGGTEVMSLLLAAPPADFAPTVLLVSHLPAETPSYLLETLSYRCALPVIEPDSGEVAVAGRVHVAPPGYHMLVDDDRTIALSVDSSVRFSRPSIDVLFESAAHVYTSRLLGILLSGANDDGAHGLEVIRAMGGCRVGAGPADGKLGDDAARRDRSGSGRRHSFSNSNGPAARRIEGLLIIRRHGAFISQHPDRRRHRT